MFRNQLVRIFFLAAALWLALPSLASAESGRVTVVVDSITVLDLPDPVGFGQYQARIELGLEDPVVFPASDEWELPNGQTFGFGWSHSVPWDPDVIPTIPVKIELWDGDGPLNPVDVLDLSPVDGKLDFEFEFDPLTNSSTFGSTGNGEQWDPGFPSFVGGERATIWVSVSWEPLPDPVVCGPEEELVGGVCVAQPDDGPVCPVGSEWVDTACLPVCGAGQVRTDGFCVDIGAPVCTVGEAQAINGVCVPLADVPPSCLSIQAVAGYQPIPLEYDEDGDALLNGWEQLGRDFECDGTIDVDLPEMGAKWDHPDIFVELDWLAGAAPTRSDIDGAKEIFENKGIALWVDTGTLYDEEAGKMVGDQFPAGLNGGGEIQAIINELTVYSTDVRDAHMAPNHRAIFRYGVSAPLVDPTKPMGIAEQYTGNFQVWFPPCGVTGEAAEKLCDARSAILAHEIGHLLGLDHGGNGPHNCKPNYVSIMNYSYTMGIPDGNGGYIYDFAPIQVEEDGPRARAPLPELDETALDESLILDATQPTYNIIFGQKFPNSDTVNLVQSAADKEIDWTQNGIINANTEQRSIDHLPQVSGDCVDGHETRQEDPDGDGITKDITLLKSRNDWDTLQFRFGHMDEPARYPEACMSLREAIALREGINTTDLSLAVSPASPTAEPGSLQTYTVTVENRGANPAYDVALHIELDGRAEFAGAERQCRIQGDEVECYVGDLQRGDETVFSLDVWVSDELPHGSTVEANFIVVHEAGPDSDAKNNIVKSMIPVTRTGTDLALEVTPYSATAVAGSTLGYKIGITNLGSEPALEAIVRIDLPESGTQITTPGQQCDHVGSTVYCPLGMLEAGGETAFEMHMSIDPTAAHGSKLSTVFMAHDAKAADSDTGNNSATIKTPVTREYDLSVINFSGQGALIELPVFGERAFSIHGSVRQQGPSGPVDVELTLSAKGSKAVRVVSGLGTIRVDNLGVGIYAGAMRHREVTVACVAKGSHTLNFVDTVRLAAGEPGSASEASDTWSVLVNCGDYKESTVWWAPLLKLGSK